MVWIKHCSRSKTLFHGQYVVSLLRSPHLSQLLSWELWEESDTDGAGLCNSLACGLLVIMSTGGNGLNFSLACKFVVRGIEEWQ